MNRVLVAGSTITALGVTCTATGSGAASAIQCTVNHHGFDVSSKRVRTF